MASIIPKLLMPLIALGVFGGAAVLPKFLQQQGALPQPLEKSPQTPRPPAAPVSDELLQATRELDQSWEQLEPLAPGETAAPAPKGSPATPSPAPAQPLPQTKFLEHLALRDFDAAEAELNLLIKNQSLPDRKLTLLWTALTETRADQRKLAELSEALKKQPGTPKSTSQLPPLPKGISIPFEKNSSLVQTEARENLTRIRDRALQNDHYLVQVRGHTDPSGKDQFNAMLAQARAEAVRDVLIDLGLPAHQITTVSFGESQATGDAPRSLRRVDIVFRYR